MQKTFAITLLLAVFAFGANSAGAASQAQYDKKAAEAASSGQQTVSVYVDVDWGARKAGSANELNQSHKAYNAHGYHVIDVVGYTENGDLQGFFVTYVRR